MKAVIGNKEWSPLPRIAIIDTDTEEEIAYFFNKELADEFCKFLNYHHKNVYTRDSDTAK